MKVIVNFNDVRVIVPCLDLDMRVKDLINESASRYRKATGKPPNSWVVIHNLKTSVDGAILDPDDRLTDVADDREQIIASFEEGNCSSNGLSLPNDNNDGTSLASGSLGTESPDTFSAPNSGPSVDAHGRTDDFVSPTRNDCTNADDVTPCNDVEVTEDTCAPVPLQVRRGSEPVLNRQSPVLNDPIDLSKRWSTAVALDNEPARKLSVDSLGESIADHSDEGSKSPVFVTNSVSPKSMKEEGYGSEEKSETTPSSATSSNTFSRFSRGSGRLSMLNNHIDVWVEAADRQMSKIKNTQNNVDAQTNCEVNNSNYLQSAGPVEEANYCELIEIKGEPVIITLKCESGPLGIHVFPQPVIHNNMMRNSLRIKEVVPNGRIDRDGRFNDGDIIVEINGESLLDVDFQKAHNIFKQALSSPELMLKVCKSYNVIEQATQVNLVPPPPEVSKRPPPPPPKPNKRKEDVELGLVEGEEKEGHTTKVATLTPTKKLTSGYAPNSLNKTPLTTLTANTRRIGRKYHIRLTKGSDGLGFSITTRDNPAGGHCPIYIKTILSKGAAILDGRLKPGDRLLEVNGIEMSNKSHMEAVAVLRNIPQGCSVDLIVSRQENDPLPSPKLPRQLPPECAGENSPGKKREVLTYEIPLNDTGSAGLGVSVKGKTCRTPQNNNVDLGIFVKAVIHGGAASKDGRLQPNDQLISINGIPLLGITNGEAMQTLQRAMLQCEGPLANPNAITLTIARRVSSSNKESCHQRNDSTLSTDSYGEEQEISSTCDAPNGTSADETKSSFKSSADATVIYNSHLSTNSSANLESSYQNKHPVIDRLIGKDITPTSKSKKTDDNASERNLSKSPTRNDVLIEGDTDGISGYLKTPSNDPIAVLNESNMSINAANEDDAGFTRDGFGRQSISEKRHAQLDAKNTDTYRRNKKAKDEKGKHDHQHETEVNELESASSNGKTDLHQPHSEGSCQSPGSCPYHAVTGKPPRKGSVGPALGMRKSSSLESLQTMMQELQKEQLENKGGNPFAGPRPATLKVSRSRGTNESFRAAVDKSYDAPNSHTEAMETVAEEGSESGSSIHPVTDTNGPSNATVPKKTVATNSVASTQFTCMSGTTASSQVTAETREDENLHLFKKKDSTKKKGLFKSFFKFGSSKKSKDSPQRISKKENEDAEKINARKAAESEQARIQEHCRRLLAQQRSHPELKQSHSYILPENHHSHTQPVHSTPTGVQTSANENGFSSGFQNTDQVRRSKTQLLRSQHQNRSSERRGNSREDDKDLVQSRERRPDGNSVRARTNSYEICKEAMERPGSRVAIVDADNKYSHYMNYREIQQQLELYNKDAAYPVTYQRVAVNQIYQEAGDRRPFGHQQRTISGPIRKKAERPLSSYEMGNHSAIMQNAALYERQQQNLSMHQQQQHHQHLQYASMPRNGMGCSSYPRTHVIGKVKQVNGNAIITRTQQPIYESAQVNIYGSNHQNGGNYGTANNMNAMPRNFHLPPANRVSPQYLPSVYQREVQSHSRPGANV